jgi:hypothetical protein
MNAEGSNAGHQVSFTLRDRPATPKGEFKLEEVFEKGGGRGEIEWLVASFTRNISFDLGIFHLFLHHCAPLDHFTSLAERST